jgi:hypothetical protein
MKAIALIALLSLSSGCCTWQGLADTGIMGAGWKNTEVAVE